MLLVAYPGSRGISDRRPSARDGVDCAIKERFHHQGRLTEEIGAWERASALLPYPALELLALGYAELAARRPQRALQEFEKAALSLPPGRERQADERFFASLARGRATALSAIGQQR